MILTIILIFTLCILFYVRCVFNNYELYLDRTYKLPIDDIKPLKSDIRNIPVFVLNLKKNPERKKHMKQFLNKLGFTDVTFVTPVDPDEARKYYYNRRLYNIPKSTASRQLSTFKIFDITDKRNLNEFIIAEDDINIFDNKYTLDDVYTASKGVDYDLLFFEMCYNICSTSKKINKHLFKLSAPLCNGFLLFTNNAKQVMRYNFDNHLTDITNDGFIQKLIMNRKLKAVGYPVIRQDPNFGGDIKTSSRYNNSDTKIFDSSCII